MTAILQTRQLQSLTDVDDSGLSEGAVPVYRVATSKFEMEALEFDYTQITSTVSVGSTSAAAPTDVIVAPSVTYDGSTVVLFQFYCALVGTPAGNGAFLRVGLWDGSTDLGRIASMTNPTGVPSMAIPVHAVMRLTPSAGAHTYKIVAWVSSGTGTINAGIGGPTGVVVPAFFRQSRAQ